MSGLKDKNALSPHPRVTNGLIGQEEAEQELLRATLSGRLPHAWLLGGPRGVGKATLAYRFARFLLAREGEGGPLFTEASRPCGLELPPEHPVSRRVAAGSHPDLFALERGLREDGRPRRDIDVESVRLLSSFLHMTSAEGGWRVAVVDSADELNANAANALLKVLEEPPANSVLLLVSHVPGRLLPTIRSRCRRLLLRPLGADALRHLLERHLPEAEPDQLALLASLADGSIGRALELAAEGGLDLYREIVQLLAGLPHLETAKAHAFADALARDASGRRMRTASDLLLWWIARLIQAAAKGGLPPALIEREEEISRRLLEGRALADWVSLWENLRHLFEQAERISLDRKQVMLTALHRLAGQGPVSAG